MGAILADCLVGLPLMRELNLRDNMLTDKGLMPIVKVRPSVALAPRETGRSNLVAGLTCSVFINERKYNARRQGARSREDRCSEHVRPENWERWWTGPSITEIVERCRTDCYPMAIDF